MVVLQEISEIRKTVLSKTWNVVIEKRNIWMSIGIEMDSL